MNEVLYYVIFLNEDNNEIIYGKYSTFKMAIEKKAECDKKYNFKSHINVKRAAAANPDG